MCFYKQNCPKIVLFIKNCFLHLQCKSKLNKNGLVKSKRTTQKTYWLVETQIIMRVWIVETTYFLIAYGWHWKAINEAEKMCNNIVGYFWAGGLILAGIVMIDIIEYLLSDSGRS